MSYIKCKSFITGKEVQYGLIEAEIFHKRTGYHYGSYSDYYKGYWNTCPSWFVTQSLLKNNEGKYIYDSRGTAGITSRRLDSGILSCSYKYVTKGKHPIISNSVYDVDKMQVGENVYNLFETDNILVQLKCIKFKVSELANATATYSFTDIDGSIVNDPYLVGAAYVQEILKSNGKVIGELDLLKLEPRSEIFANRFSVNTEIFCIDNFVPNYIGYDVFDHRIDFWYTSGSDNKDCKMLVNGQPVSSQGKFIGLVFSIFTCDYYVTSRNSYNYSRLKVVNSDGTDVDDTFIKEANTKAQTSYYINCAENNSSEFIVMCDQYGSWNVNFGTPTALTTNAESVINSEKKYKRIGHDSDIDTIFGNNFFITPILAPCVNSNYDNLLNSDSCIYIPLTDTIYEGDPEEPVDPDEPETVEPADDPETNYTPSLPGDIESGEEKWEYQGGSNIGDTPGPYNLLRPSYGNFIFDHYLPNVDEKGNEIPSVDDNGNEIGMSACNLIQNATASASYKRTVSELITGKPQLNELISRVYQLPFSYDQILDFTEGVGIGDGTITYGFLGPVLSDNWDFTSPQKTSYYKVLKKRFVPINLGNINIDRVFNNYLDYTQTSYRLFLPYGAGSVEIDPDLLFNGYVRPNDKDYHNIIINGYLDFDTGILIIKVLVNYQLYYQTSVNVAMDRIATGADATLINTIGKMIMAGAITGGMSQMLKFGTSGRDFEKELELANKKHDMRMEEINEKATNLEYVNTIKHNQRIKEQNNREEQRRETNWHRSELADLDNESRYIYNKMLTTHKANEQIRKQERFTELVKERNEDNFKMMKAQVDFANKSGYTFKSGSTIAKEKDSDV